VLAVVVGLGSAIIFGAADFLGGLSSKRLGAVFATAFAALAGLIFLILFSFAIPGEVSPKALLLGSLSGVTGATAIGLLYAALAIGPMSILSPLTAVVSAIVPLCVAVAAGEPIGAVGWIGLAVGLVAIVLVGFVPEKGAVRPTLKGLLMSVGSGVAIGAFLIIIDQAPDESGLWPLIANRATNMTIMFAIAAVLGILAVTARRRAAASGLEPAPRRTREAWRVGLVIAVACGVIDAIANAGLLWGVRIGDLSVMAVLTALYPLGTIILAAIVLKERIAPVQYVGLALAITAGALLALD